MPRLKKKLGRFKKYAQEHTIRHGKHLMHAILLSQGSLREDLDCVNFISTYITSSVQSGSQVNSMQPVLNRLSLFTYVNNVKQKYLSVKTSSKKKKKSTSAREELEKQITPLTLPCQGVIHPEYKKTTACLLSTVRNIHIQQK